MKGIIEFLNRLKEAIFNSDKRTKRKLMRQLGKRHVRIMRTKMRDIQYTGALENSVGFFVEEHGDTVSTTIGPNIASQGHSEQTIHNILHGGPPRTVSIDDLKPWAQQKLGDAEAAYAVQESIKKVGTSMYQQRTRGTMAFPFDTLTIYSSESQKEVDRVRRKYGEVVIAYVERV